jgi:hypothetical protein
MNSPYLNDWPTLNKMGYIDGQKQRELSERLRTVEHYRMITDDSREFDPDIDV